MDVSWVYMELQYKYFQFVRLKLQLIHHWKMLNNKARLFYGVSLCCGASVAGYMVYIYFEKKERELKSKFTKDLFETTSICKRRKKGLPPGLFNEGNTCFANCILQALASCSTFLNWTSEVLEHKNATRLTVFPSVCCLLKVLTNKAGNEDYYSACDVMNSLSAHGWVISTEQQDAYEFYQILQATMEEEVEKVLNSSQASCSFRESESKTTILNRVSRNLPQLLNHKLSSPFKGSFANKMTCITCGYQPPVKFETFESLILSLQNVSSFGSTLKHCLNEWIKAELVRDVECSKCLAKGLKYSSFSKQLSIAKLPKCLCIQLQRTSFSSSGEMIKNSTHVQFDEHINLSTYTYQHVSYEKKLKTPASENPLLQGRLLGGRHNFKNFAGHNLSNGSYKLSSVILHYGEADDGHFVTYRRICDGSDNWVYASDQLVKTVPKQDVFLSTAYLLFYEKI